MKALVQHIENLLPEHDCVVVPGLGGFVQNEVQARIQPGARLFYPASKEIGFNHRLKFNDGLLAQSYQETNGLSFEEANAAIQKAVQEIQEKLEAGKFIRLGRTGTLFMIEQQLVFRPDHHNHFYPEAYGLTPFTFPLLKKNEHVQQSVVEEVAAPTVSVVKEKEKQRDKKRDKHRDKQVEKQHDEFIHLRLSRTRVRQLVASAAVVLFIVFFSKPAGKPSESQEAGMMHNYLSVAVQAAPEAPEASKPSVREVTALTVHETRAAVPAPSSQIEKNVQVEKSSSIVKEPVVAINPQGHYIIVSTFVQKATAQRWLNEHAGEPMLKDARILVANGRARVYVKNVDNSEEAANFLKELTSNHSEYASAWIYSAKKD